MQTKGQNQTVTRDMNLSIIMNAIIKQPASRVDISRNFKISKPAASKITAELETLNLIRPVKEDKDNSWHNMPGVKPIPYEVNAELGIIAVLDLSTVEVKIQVCNFAGHILSEIKVPGFEVISYEDILYLCRMLEEMLKKPSFCDLPLLSLCAAIPCETNKHNGKIYWSARFDIHADFNLKEFLAEKFKTNIIVKNDVQLYLMGEKHKGYITDDIKYAILLYIDAGTGGGFYMNGHLEDGEEGTAGDIGIYPISDNGEPTLFDSVVSINAIKRRIKSQLEAGQSSSLKKDKSLHFSDIKQAFLYDKDPLTIEVINETALKAVSSLASLTSLLNINLVIIAGRIIQLGDGFINVISDSFAKIKPAVKFCYSRLADTAIKEGAMILSIEDIIQDKIKHRSQLSD